MLVGVADVVRGEAVVIGGGPETSRAKNLLCGEVFQDVIGMCGGPLQGAARRNFGVERVAVALLGPEQLQTLGRDVQDGFAAVVDAVHVGPRAFGAGVLRTYSPNKTLPCR